MLCLMAFSLCVMTGCKDEDEPKNDKSDGLVTEGYADLGLTSGTKWKATNEGDEYYTFDEATKKFGKKLPDTVQFSELVRECTWTWVGDGYKITGKNGKSIMLPAAGFRDCEGDVYNVGIEGFYWTSKSLGPQRGYRLGLYKFGKSINYHDRCGHGSVRLIE